jgi:hypothetical protein
MNSAARILFSSRVASSHFEDGRVNKLVEVVDGALI